mmetsp:Transcript_22358/g.72543  ORF Transcript_22358/g.72543 Transcript_22358/m.72543 type:complete len:130 (-) Transcript_22358:2786-3175(-)
MRHASFEELRSLSLSHGLLQVNDRLFLLLVHVGVLPARDVGRPNVRVLVYELLEHMSCPWLPSGPKAAQSAEKSPKLITSAHAIVNIKTCPNIVKKVMVQEKRTRLATKVVAPAEMIGGPMRRSASWMR